MNVSPVTIVSGLPRSGTSLMMQMLQNGGVKVLTDTVRPADEDNPRGYFELEAVKRTRHDSRWLQDAAGCAVKVIYRLLYDLPRDRRYEVIFLRRPIDEILASQGAMLKRLGTEGASLPNERLASLFTDQLTDVIKYLQKQPQFRLLEVEYHDLIDNPRGASQAISEFLQRSLDLEKMSAAVDPGLYRRRGDESLG